MSEYTKGPLFVVLPHRWPFDEKRRQALLEKMPKTAVEIGKTMRAFSDGTHPLTPQVIVNQVGPTSLVTYCTAHQQANRRGDE